MKAGTWSYDGSVGALLVLAAHSAETGDCPAVVTIGDLPPDGLFSETPFLKADSPGESEVETAASSLLSLSRRLYGAVLRTWMSEEGIEADLFAVTSDFSQRGEAALADYGKPELSRLAAAVRKVSKEVHLLEGFARFTPRKDGRYVARLEPDHNVLPALGPFFLERFGPEPFALVDLKRSYALSSQAGPSGMTLNEVEGPGLSLLEPDGDDEEAQRLWRSYFRTVENVSRRNPALQRQLMPVRYWKHLTEMGN